MYSKITAAPKRVQITWSRWDKEALRNRTSHPFVYRVIEPDGYERIFDSKLEAEDWIRAYNADVELANA